LRAQREVHAAEAILVSPRCHPRTAARHLLVAWARIEAMAETSGRGDESLPEWLRGGGAGLPESEREPVARVVADLQATAREEPWAAGERVPGAAELLAHCRQLHRILNRLDEERLGGAEHRRWRRRWALRAAGVGAALVALVIYLRLSHTAGTGRWRAQYFRTADLSGSAIVRRDVDVAFDWGRGRPLDEIRPQEFSVRWDTCLGVAEQTRASFELAAQGGGRLRVDGAVVIDTWTSLAPSQRGELTLDRGVHHLQVEYSKKGERAAVRLTVSFGNRRRQPISAGILRYPDDEVDSDDPCESQER
jgi:hypothetical protein